MTRYTPDEIAAQCAAVDTYLAEHRSHRWIADKLEIGLATVSERRRALALTAERQDIGEARLVRQEATQGARMWLRRVEEGYEREEIGLEAAGKLAAKWWDLIVRWNGAALPYRVAVETEAREAADGLARYRALESRRAGLKVGIGDLEAIDPHEVNGGVHSMDLEADRMRAELEAVEQEMSLVYAGLGAGDQAQVDVGAALAEKKMRDIRAEWGAGPSPVRGTMDGRDE